MSQIIDLKKAKLASAAKRGFRNWESQFQEAFGLQTKLSDISTQTLALLAQGKDNSSFYLYDLIMNLEHMGSGFEFNELTSAKKMAVIDRYLFVLDRIRFECMKRLGWLDSYPGEDMTLVELIVDFEQLAPGLHANPPLLSPSHPGYKNYSGLNSFDQETFVRKLIPKALKRLQDSSVTL